MRVEKAELTDILVSNLSDRQTALPWSPSQAAAPGTSASRPLPRPTVAVVNALWDLWAKLEGKPVWRLVAGMTPEQFVGLIDFRYLSDALTPQEALAILKANEPGKAARIAELEAKGFPAYTTSAG